MVQYYTSTMLEAVSAGPVLWPGGLEPTNADDITSYRVSGGSHEREVLSDDSNHLPTPVTSHRAGEALGPRARWNHRLEPGI